MQLDYDVVAPPLSDDILAFYCPVLYLHHHDEYLPVSVEWFIDRAQLNYYPAGVTGAAELHELDRIPGGIVRLIPAGQVTQDKLLGTLLRHLCALAAPAALARGCCVRSHPGAPSFPKPAEAQAACPQPGNLSLTIGPEHYPGVSVDLLGDVPIYVHAKLVLDDAGRPEAYEVNYITFYAFNGHYHLPANVPLFRTGHHVGDWEHLTVRLDAASLELQGVWYNAHRNIEGEWCPAEAVPRTPCGRIVGHVAINGHGIYPHCGTIPRLFFVANDRTSRRGPVWSPGRLVRLCGLAHGSSCPEVPSRGCSLPTRPRAPRLTASPPPPLPSGNALPAAAGTTVAAAAAVAPVPVPSRPPPRVEPAVEDPGQGEGLGTGTAPYPLLHGGQPGGDAPEPPSAAPGRAAPSPDPQEPTPGAASGGGGGGNGGGGGPAAAGADAAAAPGCWLTEAAGAAGAVGRAATEAGLGAVGVGVVGAKGEPPNVAAVAADALQPCAPAPPSELADAAAPPAAPLALRAALSGPRGAAALAPAANRDDTAAPTTLAPAADAAAAGRPDGGCGGAVRLGDGVSAGEDGGRCVEPLLGDRPGYPLPAVVHDTSPWQRYRGRWGSVVSATEQGWFLGAEPPVSRGCLRRLFLPFARGVQRLEAHRSAVPQSALRTLVARMVG